MKILIRTSGQDLVVQNMPQAPAVGERIRLDMGTGNPVFVVEDVRWIIGGNGQLDRVEVNCQ